MSPRWIGITTVPGHRQRQARTLPQCAAAPVGCLDPLPSPPTAARTDCGQSSARGRVALCVPAATTVQPTRADQCALQFETRQPDSSRLLLRGVLTALYHV